MRRWNIIGGKLFLFRAVLALQREGTAAALHVQLQSLAAPTAAPAQSKGLNITGTWEKF